MVFSGRLSAACEGCRKRRIKCDQKKPSCSQCLRKSLTCSGYRDTTAFRLRDETVKVARKTHGAAVHSSSRTPEPPKRIALAKSESPVPTDETSLANSLWCRSKSEGCSPIHIPLSLPMEDVALSYFMACFIIATPFEEYLPDLLRLESSSETSVCRAATSAAALAAVAKHDTKPSYDGAARKQYAQALLLLNKALSTREDSVQDTTLAAVLLLGFFEATIFRGGTSPTSWTAHTFGSLELLKLRGIAGSQSQIGALLFSHATTNIKTSCIQRNIPIPADLLKLSEEMNAFTDPTDPTRFLAPIIDDTARLLAAARTAAKDLNWPLLLEAWELDQRIVSFGAIGVGSRLMVTEHTESAHPWAYKRLEHLFTNPRSIKIWNAFYLLRISLHEFIVEGVKLAQMYCPELTFTRTDGCIDSPLLALTDLRDYATREYEIVAEQVLASVTSFMQKDDSGMGWRFSAPARSLVWPLAVIERSFLCPAEMRQYIDACFEKLAQDLNLAQSISAAREKGTAVDWLHLFHLG